MDDHNWCSNGFCCFVLILFSDSCHILIIFYNNGNYAMRFYMSYIISKSWIHNLILSCHVTGNACVCIPKILSSKCFWETAFFKKRRGRLFFGDEQIFFPALFSRNWQFEMIISHTTIRNYWLSLDIIYIRWVLKGC